MKKEKMHIHELIQPHWKQLVPTNSTTLNISFFYTHFLLWSSRFLPKTYAKNRTFKNSFKHTLYKILSMLQNASRNRNFSSFCFFLCVFFTVLSLWSTLNCTRFHSYYNVRMQCVPSVEYFCLIFFLHFFFFRFYSLTLSVFWFYYFRNGIRNARMNENYYKL